MTVWQVAAGGGHEHRYSHLLFNHDFVVIGPGDLGPYGSGAGRGTLVQGPGQGFWKGR